MTREEAIVLLECSATEAVGVLAATTEPSAAVQLQRCVDAYDMAISALREQSQWISVKERLPETYTNVIVLHENGHTGIEWRYKHSPCYKTANFLFDPLYGEVTHWMPLPEPPKEDTP